MIRTLNKYLPKENVSNEVVASVTALTTTKDLPKNPKENEVYHVNGVDWVFVKGEWVTRRGVYGNEDFGDAHEPLWDGTGEPPSIETQRSESKETRELSDEPAISNSESPSEEEVVEESSSSTPTDLPETEPAPAPESTPQTEASTETPAEEPSSEPESTETAPEPTAHETIEERENEAANKPDAAEEAEDDTPANEDIGEAPALLHPVEPEIPVIELNETGEKEILLAHDGVQEVSAHIQQLTAAQEALESYVEMIKGAKRISKQEAAILHINLMHIDKTFGLKTKATGLEAYGTSPRDAMETATVSVESVTERMGKIGGAIFKKIKELFERAIDLLSRIEIFGDRVKARAEKALENLKDVPANAQPVKNQLLYDGSVYLYDKHGFRGVEIVGEKEVYTKLQATYTKFYSEMRKLGNRYLQAIKDGDTKEFIETADELIDSRQRAKHNPDYELINVSGGWSVGFNEYQIDVIYDKYDVKGIDKPVAALDRVQIKKGLTDIIKATDELLSIQRLRKIINDIKDDVYENIKRGRAIGSDTDEQTLQNLQSAYVTIMMGNINGFNMKKIVGYYTHMLMAKLKYLELSIDNLKVAGASTESFDPYVFSNESIFSELGHFFNAVLHGKKSEIDMNQSAKAIAEIKKTYANPAWLKNRRFIEGEVAFKADPSIDTNFSSVINAAIGQLKQGQRGNAAVFTRAAKVVEPWTSYLIEKKYKTDPGKLETLSTTVPKFDKEKFKPVQYSPGREFSYEDVKKPALTSEQVAKAADEVIKAAEFIQNNWKNMLGETWHKTFNLDVDGGIYGRFIPARIESTNQYPDVIQGIANNLVGDEQTQAIRMANALNTYCITGEMNFVQKTNQSQYDFYYGYVRGLMNWIDASTR